MLEPVEVRYPVKPSHDDLRETQFAEGGILIHCGWSVPKAIGGYQPFFFADLWFRTNFNPIPAGPCASYQFPDFPSGRVDEVRAVLPSGFDIGEACALSFSEAEIVVEAIAGFGQAPDAVADDARTTQLSLAALRILESY